MRCGHGGGSGDPLRSFVHVFYRCGSRGGVGRTCASLLDRAPLHPRSCTSPWSPASYPGSFSPHSTCHFIGIIGVRLLCFETCPVFAHSKRRSTLSFPHPHSSHQLIICPSFCQRRSSARCPVSCSNAIAHVYAALQVTSAGVGLCVCTQFDAQPIGSSSPHVAPTGAFSWLLLLSHS